MNDTITVYRINQPPIELDPLNILFTDRSRIEDGACPRKRFLRFEYGGFGYVHPGSNEDLVVGGTVHEGLDLLLQGGSLEKAIEVASIYFHENSSYPDHLFPEQREALFNDGLHLSIALIYAFNSSYLPQLLDEHEVLEVEGEIEWEVGQTDDGKSIVMMSRPDGVLKHKQTGRLWHVSHKTAQDFPQLQLEKFKVDAQRMSESMSIWAKYGEPPEGTLYNYFLKGRRYQDKELMIDRFSSGLIHPYLQRITPGGDIDPEMISFSYEWQELEGHLLKTKRLGKGWEKVSIYNEMDFLTYLKWLEDQSIPRHRDYLRESVAGMVQEYFDQEFAERWQRGVAYSEEIWAERVAYVGRGESLADPAYGPEMDKMIPLNHSDCFTWNRRCSYFPTCFERKPIESLIEEGSMIPREPNHLVELRKTRC